MLLWITVVFASCLAFMYYVGTARPRRLIRPVVRRGLDALLAKAESPALMPSGQRDVAETPIMLMLRTGDITWYVFVDSDFSCAVETVDAKGARIWYPGPSS